MNRKLEQLFECLIQVLGRVAVPEERVREVIGTRGAKHGRAFNLADGTRTLTDIAKKARIDRGNFSRAANRWVENGIAFWVGDDNDAKLLHVYPLSFGSIRAKPKRRGGRKRTGRRR